MIAIGINNLISGENTPEEVAEGIVAVTKEAVIAFPDSRILLLGLLPAGKEKGSAIPRPFCYQLPSYRFFHGPITFSCFCPWAHCIPKNSICQYFF